MLPRDPVARTRMNVAVDDLRESTKEITRLLHLGAQSYSKRMKSEKSETGNFDVLLEIMKLSYFDVFWSIGFVSESVSVVSFSAKSRGLGGLE